MKQAVRKESISYKIAYYCFVLLLFTVPLIFTAHAGNPFHFTKDDSLKIIGGIFVLAVLYILYKEKNQKKKIFTLALDKEIDPYVIIFFLAAILSTIFSVNSFVSYNGYYTRTLGLEIYLYIFLVYIFSALIFQNESMNMYRVLFLMETTAVIASIYAFLQFTGNDPFHLQPPDSHRPLGTLGNSIFLGGFLLLVFPFSVMRVVREMKLNLSALFPLVIFGGIMVSQTRTAYAGLAAEIILILFLYPILAKTRNGSIKTKIKYSVFILGGLILLLVTLTFIEKYTLFVKRLVNFTGLLNDPRWLLWRESLKVFAKNPITGSGISAFPFVFENLYSMKFKMYNVRNFFDNAHSNYIHTLCTMGVIGLTAYLLLLGHTFYILIKSIFSKTLKSMQKSFYLSFLAMLCGYIIYGIADFDDVTIAFYFFVYLALLKSILKEDGIDSLYKISDKFKLFIKNAAAFGTFILVLFVSYNFYLTIKHIIADQYYIAAYTSASRNDFQGAMDNFPKAIELWESNSFYHYQYGGLLLSFAASDPSLNTDTKNRILEKSRSELLIASENYPSKRDCMSFVSLAYYEQGDTSEGEKIKNELLSQDSLMVNFRLSLAQFFIKKKEYDRAMEQLLFDCKYDPKSKVLLQTVSYLLRDKDCPNPVGYCKKILMVDPVNTAANNFMRLKNQK